MKSMKGKNIRNEEFENYLYIESIIEDLKEKLNLHNDDIEKYESIVSVIETYEEELKEQVEAVVKSYGVTADYFLSKLDDYIEDH